MALVLADRVKETAAAPGTGTVTLLGAVTGFQSFASVGNGNTTFYTIADQSGSNWEVGIGTYTSSGTLLSRDTVLASSNAGALVNFSAGTQDVFVTYPAERAVPSQDPAFTGSITEQVYAVSGTTPTISAANGTIQTWTLTGNSSPVDGLSNGQAITLMVDDGSAYSITWPAITWKTNAGVAPTLNTSGYTVIELWKVSTVLYGARVGDA